MRPVASRARSGHENRPRVSGLYRLLSPVIRGLVAGLAVLCGLPAAAFALSASTNAYVRSAWLELVVANRYEPGRASLETFLGGVGRGLFIRPLYVGLLKDKDWGGPLARRYFEQSRTTYHPSIAAEFERRVSAAEGA